MPNDETTSAFRSSFRGFRREDVNRYISSYSNRCKSEIEAEVAKRNVALSELAKARTALSMAEEARAALAVENDGLKKQLAGIENTESDYQERIRTLGDTVRALTTERDALRAELDGQAVSGTTPAAPKAEAVTDDTINAKVGGIILSANETGEEIIRRAKQQAELVLSRAEREASLLRVQGQSQREELARTIDAEVLCALNNYMEAYGNRINETLTALSNLYKKLYGDSNELCDRLVRERDTALSDIRNKILAALENTGRPGLESDGEETE